MINDQSIDNENYPTFIYLKALADILHEAVQKNSREAGDATIVSAPMLRKFSMDFKLLSIQANHALNASAALMSVGREHSGRQQQQEPSDSEVHLTAINAIVRNLFEIHALVNWLLDASMPLDGQAGRVLAWKAADLENYARATRAYWEPGSPERGALEQEFAESVVMLNGEAQGTSWRVESLKPSTVTTKNSKGEMQRVGTMVDMSKSLYGGRGEVFYRLLCQATHSGIRGMFRNARGTERKGDYVLTEFPGGPLAFVEVTEAAVISGVEVCRILGPHIGADSELATNMGRQYFQEVLKGTAPPHW